MGVSSSADNQRNFPLACYQSRQKQLDGFSSYFGWNLTRADLKYRVCEEWWVSVMIILEICVSIFNTKEYFQIWTLNGNSHEHILQISRIVLIVAELLSHIGNFVQQLFIYRQLRVLWTASDREVKPQSLL